MRSSQMIEASFNQDGFYEACRDGIYRPIIPITHRDKEYDQSGFDMIFQNQEKHFWHCGSIRYLADRGLDRFQALALSDSADTDLTLA